MTIKEHYQELLDSAYRFAPFRLTAVIDTKDPANAKILSMCGVCYNRRLRYLCKCSDKNGRIWYIGRDCYTELYNRQLEEP